MNLLAVVGSLRKGKATDALVDKAIEGFESVTRQHSIRKIYLADHNIKFCRNCLSCRNKHESKPVAECVIHDDMDSIKMDLVNADALVFGTPVHMGYATAAMMTFLERICWTFAKPKRKILNLKGCPLPRTSKKRKAVIIVTSGIVPPIYRTFCNRATGQIRGVIRDSLNGRVVGNLYAGDIEHRGAEFYFDKAHSLGKKLL